MAYDFSTVCPSGSVHPFIRDYGVTDPSILPHAVAEMRYRLAPEITCAMHDVVSANCFGYAPPETSYAQAVVNWMDRRHGWQVDPAWLVQTPGVMTALGLAIRAYTEPGDSVIIQTPVYGPFRRSVEQNGRTVLENPLILKNGKYTMDFADMREKAKEARMLFLCSPHNPVGRVWTKKELRELVEICLENDVLIVSDEIHFDLVYNKPHTVLATLSPEAAAHTITCTAPSKTFNLAGCGLSNIIISGEALRARFQQVANRDCGHMTNVFGYAACEATYTHCDGWLDQLLEELAHNSRMFVETIHDIFPQAVVAPLEGTYLQWVDLRCLGMSQEELMDFFCAPSRSLSTAGWSSARPARALSASTSPAPERAWPRACCAYGMPPTDWARRPDRHCSEHRAGTSGEGKRLPDSSTCGIGQNDIFRDEKCIGI